MACGFSISLFVPKDRHEVLGNHEGQERTTQTFGFQCVPFGWRLSFSSSVTHVPFSSLSVGSHLKSNRKSSAASCAGLGDMFSGPCHLLFPWTGPAKRDGGVMFLGNAKNEQRS